MKLFPCKISFQKFIIAISLKNKLHVLNEIQTFPIQDFFKLLKYDDQVSDV